MHGIDEYRKLFNTIDNMLESGYLDKAKCFVKGRIGDVRHDKITKTLELLNTLDDMKLIQEDKVEYLEHQKE